MGMLEDHIKDDTYFASLASLSVGLEVVANGFEVRSYLPTPGCDANFVHR